MKQYTQGVLSSSRSLFTHLGPYWKVASWRQRCPSNTARVTSWSASVWRGEVIKFSYYSLPLLCAESSDGMLFNATRWGHLCETFSFTNVWFAFLNIAIQVDIQALAHAVQLTRQGAVDSLRFAKGDLFQAFQVLIVLYQSSHALCFLSLARLTKLPIHFWFFLFL